MREYHVYILTNRSGTLYTGVTSNLVARVLQHRTKAVPGFTARYRIDRLIYFESTTDVMSAIEREKESKGWRRQKKIALINSFNPLWQDLSADWYDDA